MSYFFTVLEKLGIVVSKVEEFEITDFDRTFDMVTLSSIMIAVNPLMRRNLFWLFYITFLNASTFVFYICLCYTIYRNVLDEDYSEACRPATIVCMLSTVYAKELIQLISRGKMKSFIDTINKDYEKAPTLPSKEREIVKKYAMRGKSIMNIWVNLLKVNAGVFIGTSVILNIISVKTTKKYLIVEVLSPFLEEHMYEEWMFAFLFLGQLVSVFHVVCAFMDFDSRIPILVLHACGQLELSKYRLSQLHLAREETDPTLTRIELNKIISHLQEIIRFCDDIKSTCTGYFEFLLKYCTINTAVSAYQVASTLRQGKLSYTFIALTGSCIFTSFVPAYYSDLLLAHSMSVADAAYSCGWEHACDVRARRTLMLIILRAQRPLVIETTFQTISLELFSDICSQSWTLFNIMNAAF